MNRTVLYMAISLDGFVAGKDDDISWLSPYAEVDYGFDAFFAGIGAIIQGRRAYEIEAQHGWETPHPVPTFVLSHRPPERPPRRADILFTDEGIDVVLARAKGLTPKKIWIEGGAQVAQQFLRRRLVDELVIAVVPILLGEGIPLFARDGTCIPLALREVRRFDKGLVQLHYGMADEITR